MEPTSGTTSSVWVATADTPTESVLNKDCRADVCIIGAGIAGLTTAYLLAKKGRM
jgi:ribulose 1,5-bisphosphate synthetase/thiazole synthase